MKKRLYHIDLLRFLAAFYVLLYHYCFRGYSKDNFSIVEYASLEDFSKYGYLGVDLFFIISGFVILMTALNSDPIKFSISRFSRLYPAYWFCLILTTSVIVLSNSEKFQVSTFQFLTNLTMFNGFFQIPYVDGVYWSLLVELKFYILIGIVLIFKSIKHIKIISLFLLGIAILQLLFPFKDAPFALQILYFMTFPRWASYFIAGMFFFLTYKNGKKWQYTAIILMCCLVSIKYALLKADYMNNVYPHHFSYPVVITFIIAFYLLFYLISIEKLSVLNQKYFLTVGGLTYPLYLIHQNIGYIILNYFGTTVNKWLLLLALISLMIVLSYVINNYIEKPLGNYFREKLRENRFLINLKTKLYTNYTKT